VISCGFRGPGWIEDRGAYGEAGGLGDEAGEVDCKDAGLVELLRAHQAVKEVSVYQCRNGELGELGCRH
jgi:predicted RNA-binding Zn-ribbon protein involved in translation (DUF1610 family)